jgi:transposase
MSLCTILSAPGPRRRGRQPVASDPGKRAEHLACAELVIRGRLPIKRIAGLLGVSTKTPYRWTRQALGYDEPAAVSLREEARRSRRRAVRALMTPGPARTASA